MEILDFIIHVDEKLANLINLFGSWTYLILFAVIFAETGLVVIPFLPGDSLLFAVGALAGGDFLNIWICYISLLLAAILGDTVNYWIGHYIGPKAFANEKSKIFKKEYLAKTHEFYEKYGSKTIILARFVPIVRTFAPFVAGVGKMHYSTFILYNVVGGFLWVTLLTFAGYFFGGTAFVKANFEYMVFGIIIVSVLPMVYEYLKHRSQKSSHNRKNTSMEEIEKTFEKEKIS